MNKIHYQTQPKTSTREVSETVPFKSYFQRKEIISYMLVMNWMRK